MRSEPNIRIERHRIPHPPSDPGASWGGFQVGSLRIISSGLHHPGDMGWEHVSVSCADHCPTWEEMQRVKEMFWRDDETVVQFHPKKAEYVNFHPYVLHMWKPIDVEIPLPPMELIAPLKAIDEA